MFMQKPGMRHAYRCTADDVYLQPLADKFARLIMQLLAKYAIWLADNITARRANSSTAPSPEPLMAASQVSRLPAAPPALPCSSVCTWTVMSLKLKPCKQ